MTTYSSIDTNIFIYAKFKDSPFHEISKAFIDRVDNADTGYCIFQQILTEYYRFVVKYTNIQEGRESIDQVLSLGGLTLLSWPSDLTSIWRDLIREYDIEGKRVFDLQLVAAMKGDQINRIYTFNVSDFTSFSDIEAILLTE